ncbi:sodium channel protein Nach-like [Culicoides brevitarsis]|uniref:sodium channel protein Nach-like n=1 Tax=Culicoides brevitarsis TaxID=469753 RepID=UPI00307B1846
MFKSDQLKSFFPRFKQLKRLCSSSSNSSNGEKLRDRLRITWKLLINKTACRRALASTFHPYCRETSIHGLKHLFVPFAENELRGKQGKYLKLLSHIIWITSVICCAIFCLYLMVISLNNYFEILTTTSIESINYPISEVPFPAVTFCSINKVYKPNTRMIQELAEKEGINHENYTNFLKSLSKLTTLDLETDKTILEVEKKLLGANLTIAALMETVSQPCNRLLMRCQLRGDVVRCNRIFRLITTYEGFCCSFNYYALRDHLELNSTGVSNTNMKLEGAGKYVGLTVQINSSTDAYVSPAYPFYGTIIIIHQSSNYPEFSKSIDLVQPGQEVRLAVEPTVIESTENVERMPLSQRICLFPEERETEMSDDYSFSNCLSECRANIVIKTCGCIPFYYPTFDENVSRIPMCQLKDSPCLHKNRGLFQSIQVSTEEFLRQQAENGNTTRKNGLECDCPPTCSSVTFDVERFTGNITRHATLGNHSIVHVYFSALTCIKYRRDIFMTWDTLLTYVWAALPSPFSKQFTFGPTSFTRSSTNNL